MTAPDGKIPWDEEYYWWEETASLEDRLDYGRKYLSSEWRSYTPFGKERQIEREEEQRCQTLLMQAEQLGIDPVKEKIFTLSELRNRVKAAREARKSNGASSQSSVAGNGHSQASGEQAGNESDPSED
jgi:hypothetical protein